MICGAGGYFLTKQKLYPLTFNPVLKNYIWGGRNLERINRVLPEGIIAESWEIAGHEDGTTIVDNGYYAGKSLVEVQDELGLDLIGSKNLWAHERGKFPLLVKLIDANRPLSVQVHPNDEYARVNEDNSLGKTEMWVVLNAKPGAQLILGVKKGTTPELFRQAIKDGNLEDYLHYLPVKTGDHICVPSGSLHAIMDGTLIAEIQQNSNVTYRVYDWNRVGADGKSRPLHIDKSLDVINFAQVEPGLCPPQLIAETDGVRKWKLCNDSYFTVERVEIAAGAEYQGVCNGETLEIWGVIEGEAAINDLQLDAVRFTLLPAAMGAFKVQANSDAVLLRAFVK
jgi:mannose-6-phosphate isomerase